MAARTKLTETCGGQRTTERPEDSAVSALIRRSHPIFQRFTYGSRTSVLKTRPSSQGGFFMLRLQERVAFERLDLRLIEDFFEFAPVKFSDAFDRSGRGKKFFARGGSESGEFFQYVLLHGFGTRFAVERDGEPVGFVAKVHDDREFGAAFGEFYAFFVGFREDFLFSLGEGREEGKGSRGRRSGFGWFPGGIGGIGNGFRISADGLRRRQPRTSRGRNAGFRYPRIPLRHRPLDPFARRRELSFSAVDKEHRGEIVRFEPFQNAAVHHFAHAGEVVDHAVGEGFDLVLPVFRGVRFAVRRNDARSYGEMPVGMRDVVAFELEFALFRRFEAYAFQYRRHGRPSEGPAGDLFHAVAKGVSGDVRPKEHDELGFRSDFRKLHADALFFEERRKFLVFDLAFEKQYVRKVGVLRGVEFR